MSTGVFDAVSCVLKKNKMFLHPEDIAGGITYEGTKITGLTG